MAVDEMEGVVKEQEEQAGLSTTVSGIPGHHALGLVDANFSQRYVPTSTS